MAQVCKMPDDRMNSTGRKKPDDPLRYSEILEWIVDRREAYIGSSYYYIRYTEYEISVDRLTLSGQHLYSVEQIDHREHGISDKDLDEAIRGSSGEPEIPGYYHIDTHIEKKLRALLDA